MLSIKNLSRSDKETVALAVLTDGRMAVAYRSLDRLMESTIEIIDENGEVTFEPIEFAGATSTLAALSGGRFARGRYHEVFNIYQPQNDTYVISQSFRIGKREKVGSVQVITALSRERFGVGCLDGTVEVYQLHQDQYRLLQRVELEYKGIIFAIIEPLESHLIVASINAMKYTLHIYQLRDNQYVRAQILDVEPCRALSALPVGGFAVGHNNGEVHLYNLLDEQYVCVQKIMIGSTVLAFAVLPTGALTIGCENGNIYQFNNGRLTPHPIEVNNESFISGGGGLAVHPLLGLISARKSICANPNYGLIPTWRTGTHAVFPASFRLAVCVMLILIQRGEILSDEEQHGSAHKNDWITNLARLPLELIFLIIAHSSMPFTSWTSRGRGIFSALPPSEGGSSTPISSIRASHHTSEAIDYLETYVNDFRGSIAPM